MTPSAHGAWAEHAPSPQARQSHTLDRGDALSVTLSVTLKEGAFYL